MESRKFGSLETLFGNRQQPGSMAAHFRSLLMIKDKLSFTIRRIIKRCGWQNEKDEKGKTEKEKMGKTEKRFGVFQFFLSLSHFSLSHFSLMSLTIGICHALFHHRLLFNRRAYDFALRGLLAGRFDIWNCVLLGLSNIIIKILVCVSKLLPKNVNCSSLIASFLIHLSIYIQLKKK
jgi:hypothetical protein